MQPGVLVKKGDGARDLKVSAIFSACEKVQQVLDLRRAFDISTRPLNEQVDAQGEARFPENCLVQSELRGRENRDCLVFPTTGFHYV